MERDRRGVRIYVAGSLKLIIFSGRRDFVCGVFPPCESLTINLVSSDAPSWDLSLVNHYISDASRQNASLLFPMTRFVEKSHSYVHIVVTRLDKTCHCYYQWRVFLRRVTDILPLVTRLVPEGMGNNLAVTRVVYPRHWYIISDAFKFLVTTWGVSFVLFWHSARWTSFDSGS
jgi:hypothetical protein